MKSREKSKNPLKQMKMRKKKTKNPWDPAKVDLKGKFIAL